LQPGEHVYAKPYQLAVRVSQNKMSIKQKTRRRYTAPPYGRDQRVLIPSRIVHATIIRPCRSTELFTDQLTRRGVLDAESYDSAFG
jgi:hypothetical protein